MSADALSDALPQPARPQPKPVTSGRRGDLDQAILYVFVIVPFLALVAGTWLAWNLAVGWVDVALAVSFYVISCLGVTVGFHRYFTHGAFKAERWLVIVLAILGMVATQGTLFSWVAGHRQHHAFSDREYDSSGSGENDPHSPWRFGPGTINLTRGMFHAHVGWLFERDQTNEKRFIPSMLADPVLARLSSLFPLWVGLGLAVPALIGGLIGGSLWAAFTGFLWGGLIRIGFLHHVTWSINSICHVVGKHPFESRDRAGNVWPLAILSMGESWHNMHHADQASARHGVLRGQFDVSARVIWLFEKLGWVSKVRWPSATNLRAKKEQPRSNGRPLRYMGCVERQSTLVLQRRG